MDVPAVLAPDGGPAVGRSRAHVLDRLRAAGSALDVQEVARSTGLSLNTARFHLDGLVAAGLATRASQARAGPGRPRIAYRAAEDGRQAGQRRYRLLAEMLAGLVTGMLPEPGRAAAEAGHAWGRYLTDGPAPSHRLGADQAIRQLNTIMEKIGFAPEVPAQGTQEIRLRHCPFREVAENHQDIVCELHLGLMRGALSEMRAPVTADALQPFAEPGLCIARLGLAGPDKDPAQPDGTLRAEAARSPGRRPLAKIPRNRLAHQMAGSASSRAWRPRATARFPGGRYRGQRTRRRLQTGPPNSPLVLY